MTARLRQVKRGNERDTLRARVGRALQRYFITGLAALFPVVVTVGLVMWLDARLKRFFGVHIELFGIPVPGLGLVLTLFIILAVGVFTVHLFGRVVFGALESGFNRLPLVRRFYPMVKQLAQFLFQERGEGRATFRRAVIVEYPRVGSWALGFVTNEITANLKGIPQKLLIVLIPQPPSPFTGPIIFVPESDAVLLDITIEEAVKMVVSGGVVSSSLLPSGADKKKEDAG